MHLSNQKQHADSRTEKDNRDNIEDMDIGVDEDKDLSTFENIIFVGSSHNKCIICRCEVHAELAVMPRPTRPDLLVLKRMYAPHGIRSCTSNLWNNRSLDVQLNTESRPTRIARLEPSIFFTVV